MRTILPLPGCRTIVPVFRVKIKRVLQGVMESDSEPGKFFRLTPQTYPGIKIPTPSDPLGKYVQKRRKQEIRINSLR